MKCRRDTCPSPGNQTLEFHALRMPFEFGTGDQPGIESLFQRLPQMLFRYSRVGKQIGHSPQRTRHPVAVPLLALFRRKAAPVPQKEEQLTDFIRNLGARA